MKINVLKLDGTDSGTTVELSDSIFRVEPNENLVFEDIRSYTAAQRQGTAKTKNRNEVRGGGKKAYKQKGTGGARRGTLRSPLLKGGGTVFGPKPRDYVVRLTKKMKQMARKSALTFKANDKAIMVIEDIAFDGPKTKDMVNLMSALKLSDKKVLLLTNGTEKNVYLSARNLPKVSALEAYKPSTYEIVHADVLVIQRSAIETLEGTFKSQGAEA